MEKDEGPRKFFSKSLSQTDRQTDKLTEWRDGHHRALVLFSFPTFMKRTIQKRQQVDTLRSTFRTCTAIRHVPVGALEELARPFLGLGMLARPLISFARP